MQPEFELRLGVDPEVLSPEDLARFYIRLLEVAGLLPVDDYHYTITPDRYANVGERGFHTYLRTDPVHAKCLLEAMKRQQGLLSIEMVWLLTGEAKDPVNPDDKGKHDLVNLTGRYEYFRGKSVEGKQSFPREIRDILSSYIELRYDNRPVQEIAQVSIRDGDVLVTPGESLEMGIRSFRDFGFRPVKTEYDFLCPSRYCHIAGHRAALIDERTGLEMIASIVPDGKDEERFPTVSGPIFRWPTNIKNPAPVARTIKAYGDAHEIRQRMHEKTLEIVGEARR